MHQDALSGELALGEQCRQFGLRDAYRSLPLDADLLAGARIVLLRMPRSLDALEEIADAIARYASPAGDCLRGRDGQAHGAGHERGAGPPVRRGARRVGAAEGPRRRRIRFARAPRRGATGRRREFHDDLGLWVCAHGGAFAGTRIDIGTRFLLGFLARAKPDATSAVDLGCGTGVLAAALATSASRTCGCWPPTSRPRPSPPPRPPPRPTVSPDACTCCAMTVWRSSRMPRPS